MATSASSASQRLTAKRQITLRRGLVEHLGAEPGDRLEIIPTSAGTLEVRRAQKTGSIESFFGSLKYDGPPVSIDEINATIARGWAGELDDCD